MTSGKIYMRRPKRVASILLGIPNLLSSIASSLSFTQSSLATISLRASSFASRINPVVDGLKPGSVSSNLEKIIKNLPLIAITSFLFASFIFTPATSPAACSTIYKGKATINEVAGKTSGDPTFIEVKMLDLSINSGIYDTWTLSYCTKSGTCAGPTSLSTSDDTGLPYIVTIPPSPPEDYIDLNGMDIILRDGNGDTIDYLFIDNGQTPTPSIYDATCIPTFDWQHDASTSTKDIMRMPDGTGEWFNCPGGSCDGTSSDTNDPLPPGGTFPRVNVTGATVTQGGDVTFTITMLDDAHPDYATIINYQTFDGTAVAGTDYTTTSGSITFPAGTSAIDPLATQTFTVSTNASSGTTSDVYFWLNITCSTINIGTASKPLLIGTASIINNYAQGVILYTAGPPRVSVSDDSQSKGTDITFTLTLEDDANSAYDTVINYQTIDATAVAGTDHTATSGTITFLAGTTAGATQTVTVTTNDSSPSPDVYFWLYIISPIDPVEGSPTANISDHYGRGDILASSPAGPNHFDIDHDGAGINCLAEPISVTAEDSGGASVPGYTGIITLDTQTGKGIWTLATGSGTFTDATANDGLATYTYDTADLGIAIFNLEYQEGASPINIFVTDGTANDDDLEGTITFSPSGFTVTASALANPPPNPINAPMPAQTAGTAFTMHIAAYGQTPTDPTCGIIEAYTGAKDIKFWSTYDDPGTGTIQVAIDATAIATSEAGSASQSVTFTNGQASVSAKYKDVGQIQISMKDDTVAEPTPPTGIAGASNLFVVKPADFVLTNIMRTSDSFANPGAVDATSVPFFIKAGNDFTVTVTVIDSEGDPTPNFGQETTPENVFLSPTLVAPAGGITPAIQRTTGFDFSAANGTATGTDFSWPEVGIITLTPSIGDGDYLGANDIPGTITGNVGRFIPNHFITSISNNGSFLNSGTGFTYTGQPFTYNSAPVITITAQNTSNATTLNYRDTFRLLTVNDVTLNYPTSDTTMRGKNLVTPMALSVTSVAASLSTTNPMSFTFAADAFTYTRTLPYDSDNALIGPFTSAIDIQVISVSDSDSVIANDLAVPKNISPTGIGIRYGRGISGNAFGPETEPITLSVRTEFYDTTENWSPNIIDNFTSVPYTKTENAAEFTVTENLPSPLIIASGQVYLTLTQATDPDVTTDPGGTITFDFDFPSWLEPDQTATATFGIYRGNDRIINWREIAQ